MRLFAAVELSEAIRREAARVAGELGDAFEAEARKVVTWVAPDRMHLTLRFIGDAPAAVATEIVRRLGQPFAAPAFRLAVGGIGAFPRSGPPRVVWLGIIAGANELSALHDEIEARLDGLGLEREERPFRAHLTLGRVKAPLGPAARQVLASMRQVELGECEVRQVTLFESRLSPRGPTYTVRARGELNR